MERLTIDNKKYLLLPEESFQELQRKIATTIFSDEVFSSSFEKAELAKYGQEELDRYEDSLKAFRDNKATFDYAKQTAFDEGKIEVARNLKLLGVGYDIILRATGLTRDEIDKL